MRPLSQPDEASGEELSEQTYKEEIRPQPSEQTEEVARLHDSKTSHGQTVLSLQGQDTQEEHYCEEYQRK